MLQPGPSAERAEEAQAPASKGMCSSMEESVLCGPQWLQPFDGLLSSMSSSVPSLEELFVAASAPLMEIDADTTSESSATSEGSSMSSTKCLNAVVHPKARSKAAKQRRSHRHQVQELQHEIETLMHQVESLRADQLLGDSLEQFLNPKRYRPDYRLLATDAKQAAEHAQAENARLKLRVRERVTQIRSVRRLLSKQFAIAKVPGAITSTHERQLICICPLQCITSVRFRPWILHEVRCSRTRTLICGSTACCVPIWI